MSMRVTLVIKPLGSGAEWARIHSATLAKNMATERAASDHASREAERLLTILASCSCSFVSSATIPLYSSTVSLTLRQPIRSGVVSERCATPLPPAHEQATISYSLDQLHLDLRLLPQRGREADL